MALTNDGNVGGGAGGRGGGGYNGINGGGGGGSSGISGDGFSLDNSGTIAGGAGGAGGSGTYARGGGGGGGGHGVVGAGLTIVNSGTIRGGAGGAGGLDIGVPSANGSPGTAGDAILFTGGDNSLTLESGSYIDGAIEIGASANADISTTADGMDLDGGSLGTTALIVDGAATVDTSGHPFAISGAISGGGSVEKTGDGTLTLNGANTYTGETSVEGGKLVVGDADHAGASLASSVTLADGAFLGGSGTIGGLDAGGTVAPGNSIGTLAVAGDVTFRPGSTYAVEIGGGGTSDLIDVTGSAHLLGGVVEVTALDPETSYQDGQAYTILTTTGAVDGTFDDAVSQSAFLDVDLDHRADAVDLIIGVEGNDEPDEPDDAPAVFQTVAETPNQEATARALNGLPQAGAPLALYNALLMLGEDDARNAFDALSGEAYASTQTAMIEQSHVVRDAVGQRIRAAFDGGTPADMPVLAYGADGAMPAGPAEGNGPVLWGQAYGSWGETGGDGNAAGIDYSSGGILTGIDAALGDNLRLGLLLGYGHSSFDVDGRASSGDSDDVHVGVYGGAAFDALRLSGGLAYTWHEADMNRRAAFGGFADTLSGDYDAATFQAFGEAGYRFETAYGAIEPFAGLAHVSVDTDGFAETGGAAALAVADGSTETTFTTLGVHASRAFDLAGMGASAHATLGWRHAFGDTVPLSTQAFAGGDAFTVAGAPIAKDAALVQAGFDLDVAQNATLGLTYTGQFGDGTTSNGVDARLSVRF